MKRLTDRQGRTLTINCENCPKYNMFCDNSDCLYVLESMLADYEDTGLSPAEVGELIEKVKSLEEVNADE